MSWKTIRQAFKNRDMRKRIGIVLFMVAIFRLLSFVPVPIAEPGQLKQVLESAFSGQQLLGFIDLLSGGALSNFSIVLLGLGPYINASIIIQLLTKAVPKLEEISKDGENGRRKINQYTRWLTLPLAFIQSIGIIVILRQQASAATGVDITGSADIFQWALMICALVGGSMLLMWLGELITEQGVGNGISLLIFAGIISQLPTAITALVSAMISSFGGGIQYSLFGWFVVPFNVSVLAVSVGFILATLAITYVLVKINEAQRIVTVSYAKRIRGNRAYGGVNTVLPIKLIAAGVIPVIFAFAFISVPAFIGQLFSTSGNTRLAEIGQTLLAWFSAPLQGQSTTGASIFAFSALLFLLVVMFTYFYTSFVFNSKEIAENLQKQGGFIAGIRPGKQTEDYLKKIISRLNLFGSMALGTLAVLPFITQYFLGTQSLTIGGTGLLIVVSVAIETLRQIDSRALMVTYDQPSA